MGDTDEEMRRQAWITHYVAAGQYVEARQLELLLRHVTVINGERRPRRGHVRSVLGGYAPAWRAPGTCTVPTSIYSL